MSASLENNLAFIDGQNLYMSTSKRVSSPWSIDLVRFRIYLKQKYKVKEAYYFLGYTQDKNKNLYENIQKAGFILVFKQHNSAMLGEKKGNVDSDIIFQVMKRLYLRENFDKIILVSGDGDYKSLVDFLIKENRFEKILFPDGQFRSSLYKELSNKYFSYLDDVGVKSKIEKKEKGALGN